MDSIKESNKRAVELLMCCYSGVRVRKRGRGVYGGKINPPTRVIVDIYKKARPMVIMVNWSVFLCN